MNCLAWPARRSPSYGQRERRAEKKTGPPARRFEIGTVGPYERMDLGIEQDLPKKCRIAERPEEFSRQHGFEVDRLRRPVIERDAQRVGTYDLEAANVVD